MVNFHIQFLHNLSIAGGFNHLFKEGNNDGDGQNILLLTCPVIFYGLNMKISIIHLDADLEQLLHPVNYIHVGDFILL